jgi:hypothetical protein
MAAASAVAQFGAAFYKYALAIPLGGARLSGGPKKDASDA